MQKSVWKCRNISKHLIVDSHDGLWRPGLLLLFLNKFLWLNVYMSPRFARLECIGSSRPTMITGFSAITSNSALWLNDSAHPGTQQHLNPSNQQTKLQNYRHLEIGPIVLCLEREVCERKGDFRLNHCAFNGLSWALCFGASDWSRNGHHLRGGLRLHVHFWEWPFPAT